MNKSTLSACTLLLSSLGFGCAATDQAPETQEGEILGASQELTVAECGTKRDTCLRTNLIFGLFTCPAQYTQCVATAENGIPTQVTAAISSARDCTEAAAACVLDKPTDAAGCAATQAQCVADIVGVKLPTVVEGTAQCVDAAVDCIEASTRATNLTACATSLNECALEQAAGVVEEVVGEVITEANKCRIAFESCVGSAEGAVAIAQCGTESTVCAAGVLDVQLPNVPLEDVVACGDEATDCALSVRRPSDVLECAQGLTACAGQVVEDTTNVPPALTCQQKWTACIAKNPFNFFGCNDDLNKCQG